MLSEDSSEGILSLLIHELQSLSPGHLDRILDRIKRFLNGGLDENAREIQQ